MSDSRKIFISYKYADKYVRQNDNYDRSHWMFDVENGNYLTARNYVDHLIDKTLNNHIIKAEKDNEDLSHLTEEIIQKKLYDRIFDSTITIVLISKNMKENSSEKEQWIPLEVRYSLIEKTREEGRSLTNGMIAVVLPDENGNYSYFVNDLSCGVRSWNTGFTFPIIHLNMFNKKKSNASSCNLNICSGHHTGGNHSYICLVKWDDFVKNSDTYIEQATSFRNRIDEFDLTKEFK